MSSINKILVAIDDESDESIIIQKGLALAHSHHAEIMFYIVLEHANKLANTFKEIMSKEQFLQHILEHHRSQIEEIVRTYNTNQVNVAFEFGIGVPYVEIIRKAFEFKADIILQSSRSHDQGRLFFSSSDWRLIRKSPVPVWIVKNNESQVPKNILVAIDVMSETDNSEFNKNILKLALEIADASNSHLTVISAWEVFGEEMATHSPFFSVSEQQIDNILEKTAYIAQKRQKELKTWIKENLSYDYESITWRIKKGNASKTITSFASDHDIGLLIIGTLNRTGVPGFFIGNTAETVLSKVRCSVITMKPSLFVSPVK